MIAINMQITYLQKLNRDLGLLLWKRKIEYSRSPWDIAKILVPAVLAFLVLLIFYESLPGTFLIGGMEEYLVPLGFMLFLQRIVTQITFEKHNKLFESLKMAGMYESSYWLSYMISEGLVVGFVIAFIGMLLSIGPVFGEDADCSPIVVWSFLFMYGLSSVTFAFFIASCFDTPQAAGQGALATVMGGYVLYLGLNLSKEELAVQRAFCFIPPVALQIGSGSQKRRYDGIDIGEIISYLFLDIFIYGFLAWYVTQVRPSEYGTHRPPWFILDYQYWRGLKDENGRGATKSPITDAPKSPITDATNSPITDASRIEAGQSIASNIGNHPDFPQETVNMNVLGQPKIQIGGLHKHFSSQEKPAVNNVHFNMYENQIFALLGHNGAGKTTAINMLTGLIPVGARSAGDTTIYGHSVVDDMDACRMMMGVCPQHDVLFPLLNVEEHILLFSQLKGFAPEAAKSEVTTYAAQFQLSERVLHLGAELSGGQRRKLSVALAVCGGSKFVVLDEPTAGMDVMARRELWDLLKVLRVGRTMLLTTHYMDEADTLGSRIGIMSVGELKCIGSPQYLKTTFGAGYRLSMSLKTVVSESGKLRRDPTVKIDRIIAHLKKSFPDCDPEILGEQEMDLSDVRKSVVRRASESLNDDSIGNGGSSEGSSTSGIQVRCILGFDQVVHFGKYFNDLQQISKSLGIDSYGITVTSMEDVFLSIGGDEDMLPDQDIAKTDHDGIGESKYDFDIVMQISGMALRKWSNAKHDFVCWSMLLLPMVSSLTIGLLYQGEVIYSNDDPGSFDFGRVLNNIISIAIYFASMLMVPGLLAEFIVRERETKLRTVLTVMGCDFRAYWLGTFVMDFILLSIPSFFFMMVWGIFDMEDFYSNIGSFFIVILFNVHLISFSYIITYVFSSAKSAVFISPSIIVGLLLLPNLCIGLYILIFDEGLGLVDRIDSGTAGGIMLWGLAVMTPHGNFFASMMDTTCSDLTRFISDFPPSYACVIIAIVESALFFVSAYYMDIQSIAELRARNVGDDENDVGALELVSRVKARLDDGELNASMELELGLESHEAVGDDVVEEAKRVKSLAPGQLPLRVDGLRRVFLPKTKGRKPIAAAKGVHFGVDKGEVFGLLGANGAGKTTTLNMLTRHLSPTAGDAEIGGASVLSSFAEATKFLGVVSQDNSLWDLLTVDDHLRLFARLRGVPSDHIEAMVSTVVNQLELKSKHRHKLAKNLSGGMKRKLCVAIALIGNPDVCLLDEPSAGLDPVSRRNLWNVITRTMAGRAVVLTTHSMEEAEALCDRIGIMVQGQLRVVGTKQQLKSSMGE